MSIKLYILITITFCMGVLMALQNPLEESVEQALVQYTNQEQPSIMTNLAQSDGCNENILTIMEQTALICEALGENEICYGNRNVEITPNDIQEPMEFLDPGDLLPLNQVRSLRLSTLDLENDIWGVAQIRLLLADFRNVQDVELLLFGDVFVEDSNEAPVTIDVQVLSPTPISLRMTPDLNGLVVTSAQPNQALRAVARNADGTWIQVEELEIGYLGWIFADLIAPSDASESLNNLLISDGDDTYWKPMQAFVFQSGDNASCGNTLTDGMLIQTADGLSRITFLINEVVVELLPGTNNTNATAFLQSNVTNGMAINVIAGNANVTVGGVTYAVSPNTSLNIPLNPDGLPVGTASLQTTSQSAFSWLNNVITPNPQRLILPTQNQPVTENTGSSSNNTTTTTNNNTTTTNNNTTTTNNNTTTNTNTGNATPSPTRTSVPPTFTSVPPTFTSVPPTFTSVPPTFTSVPPTFTSVPPTEPPPPTNVPPTDVPPATPCNNGNGNGNGNGNCNK